MERESKFFEDKEAEPEKSTRVVVMLGASMEWGEGEESGTWKFPLVVSRPLPKEGQLPVEVSGGWGRMRAIESIYHQFLETKKPDEQLAILVTGGIHKQGDQAFSRAEEAANKLREKYHVPSDIIHTIGQGGNTLGNAADTINFISEHKQELGRASQIEIVTQDFHLLRAWIMFVKGVYERIKRKAFKINESDIETIKSILTDSLQEEDSRSSREKIIEIIRPYIVEIPIEIKPVSVEEQLMSDTSRSKGVDKYVNCIKENSWVKKTRELEARGIIDLLEGRYNS